jgi:acyl-CoA thioester hydrolase
MSETAATREHAPAPGTMGREMTPPPDAAPLRTYQGVVYPWQCDHVGHMNVMWYVGKFDEATWFFLDAIGLTRTLLAAERRGMAAVEQRIAYERELLAGDAIAVETTLLEVRPRVLRFAHRMLVADGNATAAVMMQTTVHLDLAARKAVTLPDAVRRAAEARVGTLELPWERRRT